jgi:hypothetical protein
MSKNGEPSVTAAVTRIIEHMRYLSGTWHLCENDLL